MKTRYFLLFIFSVIAIQGYAQSTLKMGSSGGPSGSGPSTSNKTITLYENGTTAFSPTVTVTYSISNQQFPSGSIEGITDPGFTFGGTLNTSANSPLGGRVYYEGMNGISSPLNNMFSGCFSCGADNGINVSNDYALNMFLCSDALINSSGVNQVPINSRVYYGDLTLTFSQPVSNPVFQVVGLGGYTAFSKDGKMHELGYCAEFDLISPSNINLTKLDGNSVFSISGTTFSNTATYVGANSQGSSVNGQVRYAASGSMAILGTNITSVKFKVYLRGDGGRISNTFDNSVTTSSISPVWSHGSSGISEQEPIVAGDRFLMGVSIQKPVTQVSGTVFNDPDGGNVNNSSGTTNLIPSGLYAILVDVSGNVLQSTAVATDGTYSFTSVWEGNYTIQLSTSSGTVGNAAPSIGLVSGYINKGEYNGTPNTGSDGNANGQSAVFTVTTSAVTNINFGIAPTPEDCTNGIDDDGDGFIDDLDFDCDQSLPCTPKIADGIPDQNIPTYEWKIELYEGYNGVANASISAERSDHVTVSTLGTPILAEEAYGGFGASSFSYTKTNLQSSDNPFDFLNYSSKANIKSGGYSGSTTSGAFQMVYQRIAPTAGTLTIGEAGAYFDDHAELYINGSLVDEIIGWYPNLPASEIINYNVSANDWIAIRLTNVGGPGGFSVDLDLNLEDNDLDNLPNQCDLDDDNDGILDTDECPIPTSSGLDGPLAFTYDISTTDANSASVPHTLNSITFNGTTYADFILPNNYTSAFSLTTPSSAALVKNGSIPFNYSSNANYDQDILTEAFQTRNLNAYQALDNNNYADGDYYTLTYNSPITSTDGGFIAVAERLGNNPQILQALDINGNIIGTTLNVETSHYIDLGVTISSSPSQHAFMALYPIDDLAPVGTKIYGLKVSFGSTATSDGPDAKVFFFGDFALVTCDYDGDGIPNNLDLDSDNDGCPDAIEGGAAFSYANLQNNSLAGVVDGNGVPIVANGGQSVGQSQNTATVTCDEICNDGIDNDGDGLIDCADSDCKPVITNVVTVQPSCSNKTGGQITISATSSGTLSYSIKNEAVWQSSNVFTNLGVGQYTIRVKNNSGCEVLYTSNPIIFDTPPCVEICNDGIDNDGDGLIDCDDPDCEDVGGAAPINH